MAPANTLSKQALIVSWLAQIAAAAILAQTLFFKFSGAPEAVYIFSTLGVEPWGRIATALLELVAVVLFIVPRTAAFGALLGIGLMVGALGAHLTRLGIEVQGDGGTLFTLAIVVLIASVVVLVLRRRDLARAGTRSSAT